MLLPDVGECRWRCPRIAVGRLLRLSAVSPARASMTSIWECDSVAPLPITTSFHTRLHGEGRLLLRLPTSPLQKPLPNLYPTHKPLSSKIYSFQRRPLNPTICTLYCVYHRPSTRYSSSGFSPRVGRTCGSPIITRGRLFPAVPRRQRCTTNQVSALHI
jgi:hypothetical protein